MKRSQAWTLIAVAVLAVSLVVKDHWLAYNGSNAQLLWRSNEAYLVVGSWANGYRMTWPMFLIGRVAAFGVPMTHRRLTISIFRITPTGVEQHDVPGRGLSEHLKAAFAGYPIDAGTRRSIDNRLPDFGAAGDHIDTQTQRWMGNRFEPMTPEEIEEGRTRPHGPPSFDNVQGWSKRTLSFTAWDRSKRMAVLDFAGQPAELRLVVEEPSVNTVELQRSGNPPERLWSMDGRRHRVSRSEFDSVFGPSSPDR